MMRTRSKVVLVALALAVAVSRCGGRPSEDVRATVDGSQLVLENRSNTDVHFQLIQPLTAFIPLSTPLNRLEDGRTLELRIAPSQRGETIDMAWWRPGDRIDGSEIRGPDRVRKICVKLAELAEPLPTDEAYVRACIALAAATAKEQRERPGGAGRELARTQCLQGRERLHAAGRAALPGRARAVRGRTRDDARDARPRGGGAGRASRGACGGKVR